MTDFTPLIEEIRQAKEGSMGLSRQIALATGWHKVKTRYSRHGAEKWGWIAPWDWIGGTDERPVLDGLHGTTISREPLDYSRSLDAAMSLIPKELDVELYRLPTEGYCEAQIFPQPWIQATTQSKRFCSLPIKGDNALPRAVTCAALMALQSRAEG